MTNKIIHKAWQKWAKFGSLSLIALTTVMTSNGASAHITDECDYENILMNMSRYEQYFNKSSVSVKYKNSFDECILEKSGKVRNILNRQVKKRVELENELEQKIHAMFDESLNSSYDLRYTNLDLTGSMNVRLTPMPSGKINARIGGFGFKAKAKVTLNNVPSAIFKVYGHVSAQAMV